MNPSSALTTATLGCDSQARPGWRGPDVGDERGLLRGVGHVTPRELHAVEADVRVETVAVTVEVEEGAGPMDEVAPPRLLQPVDAPQAAEQWFETVQIGIVGMPHGPER